MPSSTLRAHPELPEPTPADAAWITSFLRSLRASNAAANTVNVYRLAVLLLARWCAGQARPALECLRRADLEDYLIWMQETARKRDGEPFTPGYVNNQYRALLAFFNWLSEEEEITHPMAKLKAPKVIVPVVPLVSEEDFRMLIKPLEKARDFDSRRDLAIIRMFFSSGLRIEELTMLPLERLDLDLHRVTVLGKGGRERRARFDLRTGEAVDRYLRVRSKHRFASENPRLWLPTMHRLRSLTTNGVRQMVRRRAAAVGLNIHPHMFRHTYSHTFLVNGGEEGDLMEQNGWASSQMIARYGASARSQRAQSNYDRIMGPGL